MMYPFLTLDDGTEITHSEKLDDASVKVYIEKADEKDCFHHATCYLPSYRWEDVFGFSKAEMERYQEVVESTAHLMLEFAETGCDEGLDHEGWKVPAGQQRLRY